jgi:hypothetical protein
VLASHIIHELTWKESSPFEVLYFFFKHSHADKETPLAAIRALVHQLLLSPRRAAGQTAFIKTLLLQMDSGGQSRVIGFRALWETFFDYCVALPGVTIILDALDECSAARLLLPGLMKLVQQGCASGNLQCSYK